MKKLLVLIFVLPALLFAQTSSGIGSVATSGTGTAYVALASGGSAKTVHIINDTGTALEARLGGAGATLPIAADTYLTFRGLSSLSQVQVRRADVSATPVTVKYLFEY